MKMKKELMIIFAIQVTEVLGFSLILPFLPIFAQNLGASPFMVGLILSSFSLFQFISAPIMGKLSDSYGRRPLLILSQISTFLGFVILGFSNSLWMIFLSRIVDGLLGSNFTIAQAYISDVTSKKDRSKAFGLSGAAFGIGFFIGPAIGGILAKYSFGLPSFLAAGITLITIFLTYFLLPETIEKKGKFKFDIKIINFEAFSKYFSNKKLSNKLWQFFWYILTHSIFVGSFALFVEKQLKVGPQFIGLVFSFVGFSNIILRGVLLGKIIKIFGEDQLKYLSYIGEGIGFLFLSFVTNWQVFLIFLFFFVFFNASLRPVIMGDISKSVSEKEQGVVLGLTNSLASISQIIGPLLGGFLIDRFFPGSIGLVSALIMGIGFMFVLREKKLVNR